MPLIYPWRVFVVARGGLGFPAFFLQLPHQLIGGGDIKSFRLMFAINFTVQEAIENRMIGAMISYNREGDDVPLHFRYLPFLTLHR